MAERLLGGPWTYRGVFVLIALVLLFVRLLPMGNEAGQWPGPDLMLCLIIAWMMRRPDYLPVAQIAVVVLIEDMLLMRPPGLWTALVVLATEFLRGRVALTRELSIGAEWLVASVIMIGLFVAYRVVFTLTMMPQPALGFVMVQTIGSILCYPAVVAVSRYALDVQKPATGEVDARGRRL